MTRWALCDVLSDLNGAKIQELFNMVSLLPCALFDTCADTQYGILMLKTFRHKGLKRLFESDNPSGVRADQVRRIKDVLANLDQARRPSDLDLPGYRLHTLRGEWKGYWSVTISGNWRILFRFEDGDTCDVDLVDYH